MTTAAERVVLLANHMNAGTGRLRRSPLADVDVQVTPAGALQDILAVGRDAGREVVLT